MKNVTEKENNAMLLQYIVKQLWIDADFEWILITGGP